jgi:(p)ppGpp synthase/HD superfamily hydrolase
MATLEKAIELAARAHAGQLDKDGFPYILHPLRVMLAVEEGAARIVGVLHDTIEDTSLTEDDLRREGFGEEVLAALRLVTHGKDTNPTRSPGR